MLFRLSNTRNLINSWMFSIVATVKWDFLKSDDLNGNPQSFNSYAFERKRNNWTSHKFHRSTR